MMIEFSRYEELYLKNKHQMGSIIVFLSLFVISLYTIVINTANIISDTNKYCRDRDRLITSEEIDDYLLVGVITNSTIILECAYW